MGSGRCLDMRFVRPGALRVVPTRRSLGTQPLAAGGCCIAAWNPSLSRSLAVLRRSVPFGFGGFGRMGFTRLQAVARIGLG